MGFVFLSRVLVLWALDFGLSLEMTQLDSTSLTNGTRILVKQVVSLHGIH